MGRDDPQLLTASEAAALLNVSLRTMRTLISTGRIPAVRISPRIVRIRRCDLVEFGERLRETGL